MKKSFMNNIKHFVDSNVRHRIDKVAHNNNEFFGDDLLLVERHFEEIRNVCIEAEKRISILLQSIQTTQTFGAYTQNVQAGLNNLSQNISQATVGTTTSASSSSANNMVTNISNIPSNAIRESSSKSAKHHPSPVAQSIRSNEFHGSSIDGHLSDLESTQQLTTDIQLRHKKLPIVGFLKFLVKFCDKLKPGSLLGATFTHFSQLQTQLTKLYLSYDQTIEAKCLKPIQQLLEVDIPNVIRLRKLFIKSHNDLESLRMKYNGASQKQQLHQTANSSNTTSYSIAQTNNQLSNLNKLDNLKKDLDECLSKFEQAKDAYETELFAFVCRETELVDLLRSFYQLQADYHQQVANVIQGSLPGLDHTLANTSRKLVFGTNLDEHLRCTGRLVSPLIEICTHLLFTQGLREEGLFRVPGSSVKIKKLKHAINAWFVTLASNNNNNNNIIINKADQPEQKLAGYTSIVALHDLFKRIAGQTQIDCCQQSTAMSDDTISTHNEVNFRTSLLYFDVHSIAGLLKLYLRELPEPLFTFNLYGEWIGAMKLDSHEERLNAIIKVLEKLPKTNYENLKHLTKFLHLLTLHQEQNKMTSTNLAITMAPSLMWSKPSVSHASSDDQSLLSDANIESTNSLNIQMSNIGLSASMHALVIETLIKNADFLFQDQEVDFTLPGFEHLTLHSTDPLCSSSKNHQQDRSQAKSTSPTGMSTTSSSSFSSTASQSKASPKTLIKTHSRKGGSMDGLINDPITYESVVFRSGLSNGSTNTRPMSVYLNKSDYSTIRASQQNPKQPPPVPPMPRSYLKSTNLNSEHASSNSALRSNQDSSSKLSTKMPAPPVPPAVCLSSRLEEPRSTTSIADLKPRATSLRGTGTILPAVTTPIDNDQSTSSNHGLQRLNVVARPSCPPPERPMKLGASDDGKQQLQPSLTGGDESVATKMLKCPIKSDEADSRSSHSLNSSGNLRADFEEISARDMDVEEVDISSPISPVASINSVSVEEADDISDDSSFNNDVDDDQSLDYSWAEFNLTKENGVVERGLSTRRPNVGEYVRVLMDPRRSPSTTPRQHQQLLQPQGTSRLDSTNLADATETRSAAASESSNVVKIEQRPNGEEPIQDQGSRATAPPKKPPRSISPKITQSTPL